MISVSSTMVVLKTLAAQGVTTTLASRVMIGLLVIQDLAVIPMLAILPQLNSLDGLAGKLAKSLGIAAVMLGVVAFVGTRLLPKLLQLILKWGSRELFLVAVVAIGVGVGYAAHAVGMSFALGAFVAGMVLSESEFSHQALSDVVPLRDIFGLLFFVTVGMLFDPGFAIANAGMVAITVAAIFVGKGALLAGITRAFSYGNMAPWIVGLGLSQIGEFSFVLARTGASGNLISKATYDLALTCTVLTMALSPLVSSLAIPLGRRFRAATPNVSIELPQPDLADHVIVAGYGRSGRAAARALRTAGIPIVVIESNHSLLADIRDDGFEAIWGDIASPEILHAAHAELARVLLLAVPDRNTVHLAIERARHMRPKLMIVARALRERHVAELQRMKINAVVQPEFEGGVEMVRQVLELCGRPENEASAITGDLRRRLYSDPTGNS